jgi:MFS family permease
MMVHVVPYGIDLGIPMGSAATVLAAIGGVSIAGRVIMGGAGDRLGARLAISVCFPVMAATLVWLQFSRELWMLYLFAIVYGFVHGGFFALLSPLVAELFGLGSHGAIFGTILFSAAIGASVGPFLVGYIFDVTSSYQLGFLICSLLVASSFLLALLLRPPRIENHE